MNKIKTLILAFLLTSVLLTSCINSARFYTANRNPLPMFKNKGDVYIDFSTNITNKADLTAGYALTNNVGGYIGIAGAKEQNKDKSDPTNNYPYTSIYTRYHYNGEMFNYGFGYFINQKQSSKFRFEIFGDLGMGYYNNTVDFSQSGTSKRDDKSFSGNYKRMGGLMNLGYSSFKGLLTYGYSIRLSNISFSNANISDPVYYRRDQERLNHKPDYQLLEHAIFCKIGYGVVKGQIQFAFYHGLNASPEIDAVQELNGALMFGVVINPNLFSNQNKSK